MLFHFLNFSQYVVCMFGHKNLQSYKSQSPLQREIFRKKKSSFKNYNELETSLYYKVVFLHLWHHKVKSRLRKFEWLAGGKNACTETPSKLFANHNALGQLTNHNTFRFSEGGPSSNPELIEPFVPGGVKAIVIM